MRIISGTAGGLTLKVPPVVARPTTDRVREAIFSMLGDAVEGARVLDIFAGSGALGIECLSRGAREAHFIEQHAGACAVIQANLARATFKNGRIVKADAFSALRRLAEEGSVFDLIFADPPYAKKAGDTDFAARLLAAHHLGQVLAPDGLFILETMVTKQDDRAIPGWEVIRDRAYGSTRILILKPATTDDAKTPGAALLQPALPSGPAGHGTGGMEEDAGARREDG